MYAKFGINPIFATMGKKFLPLVLSMMLITAVKSQIGGSGVFQILESPLHARTMAFGGYLLAQPVSDIQYTVNNPALLNASLHKNYGISYGTLITGVTNGGAGFGFSKGMNNYSIHAQYLDYGTMRAMDAGGNSWGTVSANETKVTLGYSREIKPRLMVGAHLGFVYSVLEPYVSNGFFGNLGMHYTSKDTLFQVGFVVKNAGFMNVAYRNAEREPLPFNIQLGAAYKPQHMPVRFHMTLHSLQQFDITYNQYLASGQIDLSGNEIISQEANFGEKLFRHVNLGVELILGKHFSILGGYNDQRRFELAPEARKGSAGFSWGFRIKTLNYHITYGSASYFPGFTSNMFSLSLIPTFFR